MHECSSGRSPVTFPGPCEELEGELISCPRLQGQADGRAVFGAQMYSCEWDGGSLEHSVGAAVSHSGQGTAPSHKSAGLGEVSIVCLPCAPRVC